MRRFFLIFYALTFFFPALSQGASDYSLKKGVLLTKTLLIIERYYFEPGRINAEAMFNESLRSIERTTPEVLAKCEEKKFCTIRVDQASKRFNYPTPDLKGIRMTLREMFAFIDQHANPETKREEVEYAAIAGLLRELDPHSDFLDPEVYEEFRVGTKGEFGGLGIVITIKEGHLTVTAPIEGTPAWKAGIKSGDHITQIEEESTINMPLTEAVERLRGPVGSTVTIQVLRTGNTKPKKLAMTRDIINIQAVQSKVFKTEGNKTIGLLRIKSFQGNTQREVYEHLSQLQQDPSLKGIILDLRDNPGGLLDQAIEVADAFLKEGTIVSTVGPSERLIDRQNARAQGFEMDIPLIVLVNSGSASASEIVAGALKNNNRAIIVGTQTFGKGSVQSIYDLPEEAAVKLTVAQYFTPGDKSIQSVGITPDIELFPVVVDKKQLNLIKNVQMLEKDLEKSISKNGDDKDLPAYYLRFLQAPELENETAEYSTEISLAKDRMGQFALSFMDSLTHTDRTGMLADVQKKMQDLDAKEQAAITTACQAIGIDWDTGKAETKNPQAQVSYNLYKNGEKIREAKAGDLVILRVELKNVGTAPFYRLAAQTESEIYLLKNLEFAFGKIEPGKTKTWETELKMPEAALTETLLLTLHFIDKNNQAPAPLEMLLPVKGEPRPLFAHRYRLEENWFAKLQQGEPVTMTIDVANHGKGTSDKPTLSIRNLGGRELFIEKGRHTLGLLKPEAQETATVQFHTNVPVAADQVHLELLLLDSRLLVVLKQEITLSLKEAKVYPPTDQWYAPPQITVARENAKATKTPFTIEGTAKDDQTMHDLFIFVDDQKAHYETNAANSTEITFKAPVSLKEGNNMISITARDNWNLISSQSFVVNLEAKKENP